jgi:hypothetical protein
LRGGIAATAGGHLAVGAATGAQRRPPLPRAVTRISAAPLHIRLAPPTVGVARWEYPLMFRAFAGFRMKPAARMADVTDKPDSPDVVLRMLLTYSGDSIRERLRQELADLVTHKGYRRNR